MWIKCSADLAFTVTHMYINSITRKIEKPKSYIVNKIKISKQLNGLSQIVYRRYIFNYSVFWREKRQKVVHAWCT